MSEQSDLSPHIRHIDEHGNTVAASARATDRSDPLAPLPFDAKPLTNKQVAKIAAISPKANKRHQLALCMAVECSLPNFMNLRLDEVRQMVDAVAAIEGRDLPPLELLAETEGVFFGAATADQRKPISDRLVEVYGPRFANTPSGAQAAVNAATRRPVAEYDPVDAEVVVKLSRPFSLDGRHFTHITLRPPTYGHVRAAAVGIMTRADMIADMADVPVDVIDALRWPDAIRVLGIAADMAPDMKARN